MTKVVLTTQIPEVPKFITGKVRDVYDLGETLLIVATDRISAFDVIMPTGIPDKGRVLTQLSLFWFDRLRDIVPNHVIAADTETISQYLGAAGVSVTAELANQLSGRSMLVKKCRALPLECVVRGYLAGSAFKDYKTLFAHGGEVKLYDLSLPVGLRECDRLPIPLFTPATKADTGHDENITMAQAAVIVGQEALHKLQEKSLALYNAACVHAASKNLIIADTKFEFGICGDKIVWIDEALTPDSSRFWDANLYKPGRSQPSFDKQFVRDYLETLDWNKTPPGPELPAEIVEKSAEKYRDAYRRITGEDL